MKRVWKMSGEETEFDGIVISWTLTMIAWVAIFLAGWFVGKFLTGSELGGLAGILFPLLAQNYKIQIWTHTPGKD